MADVEIIQPEPQQIPELARICFEAFKEIDDQHGFPPDLPHLEAATKIINLLTSRRDYFAVAARVDGRLAGSSFMSLTSEIGGVGPVSVDPRLSGQGIGRRLMNAVLKHAQTIGLAQVRLLQSTYNLRSLSLYSSLGFDVQTTIGVMVAKPAANPDPSVRRAIPADVPALDELCRRVWQVSRRNEIDAAFQFGFATFLRASAGRPVAYYVTGPFGHGVADHPHDLLAIIGEAARHTAGEMVFLCPLIRGDLYRGTLQAGHRLRKLMVYMTLGPYSPPAGYWLPSISY
jgi:GNAT superfamily N-acetyltransferase